MTSSLSIWQDMVTACGNRQTDPSLIIRPEKFQDHISSAKRGNILRDLRKKGWSVLALSGICPMTDRGIRKIVATSRNGSANPTTVKG